MMLSKECTVVTEVTTGEFLFNRHCSFGELSWATKHTNSHGVQIVIL
jgi:hypothetical protein